MTQNKNIYPHLPTVNFEIDGPPWPDHSDGSLVLNFRDDGSLNVTGNSVSALDAQFPEFGNIPGCVDNIDPSPPKPLTIDSLAKPSAYPGDYNKQVRSWLEDLRGATSTDPEPSSSAKESQRASQSHVVPGGPANPGI